MKKVLSILSFFFVVTLALSLANNCFADDQKDNLASEKLSFDSQNGHQVIDLTATNIKQVFETYTPAVDSSSQVVSPKVVSGSASAPRLQVGIRACVFFICQTVSLDADITVQAVNGSCDMNLLLTANLMRSSQLLTEKYDALNVAICLNKNTPSGYLLTVSASAHRSPQFSSGIVADNVQKFLKMQTTPMLQALNQNLVENGAQNLKLSTPGK